jgi:hypothetical protein
MAQGSRERQERVARNESLFRDVNERVERLVRGFGATQTAFLCECADRECIEEVFLTLEEYAAVRTASAQRFVVRPGHVARDVEAVVQSVERRYEVVEKHGRGGEVALELDPRA